MAVMMLLFALSIVFFLAIPSVGRRAPLHTVNAVIGDAAAVAVGDDPQELDETTRLAQHLLFVTDKLSAKLPPLAPHFLSARVATLGILRQYALRGRFPVHDDQLAARASVGAAEHSETPVRVPLFIDSYGVRCAVGELMHASGAGDLALRIAQARPFAYVDELIRDQLFGSQVRAWVSDHGFASEEIGMIQPSYSCCSLCDSITNVDETERVDGPCYPVSEREIACEWLQVVKGGGHVTEKECLHNGGYGKTGRAPNVYVSVATIKGGGAVVKTEYSASGVETVRRRRIDPVPAERFSPDIQMVWDDRLNMSFSGSGYSDVFDVPVSLSFNAGREDRIRLGDKDVVDAKYRQWLWWTTPAGVTMVSDVEVDPAVINISRNGTVSTQTRLRRTYGSYLYSPLRCGDRRRSYFATQRGDVFVRSSGDRRSAFEDVVFPSCVEETLGFPDGESAEPCFERVPTPTAWLGDRNNSRLLIIRRATMGRIEHALVAPVMHRNWFLSSVVHRLDDRPIYVVASSPWGTPNMLLFDSDETYQSHMCSSSRTGGIIGGTTLVGCCVALVAWGFNNSK